VNPILDQLVKRAQSGDTDAFAEVVRRMRGAVYATAYQIVLDRDAALDVAQDTFIRAYEQIGSLRDLHAFPGWIVRMCRNAALARLRKREPVCVALDEIEEATPDSADEIVERTAMGEALATLPEHNRHALALWLVDGYTYGEVAELTGVPLSTVKGRIQRARKQIAAEVLTMVETTLRHEAPGEEFTEETIREVIGRSWEASKAGRTGESIRLAEEAISGAERADLSRPQALPLLIAAYQARSHAVYLRDSAQWQDAQETLIRLAEESGDKMALAAALEELGVQRQELALEEREAMIDRAIALRRELGQHESIAQTLFFRAFRLMGAGSPAQAAATFDEARAELADQPYCVTTCLLDSAADLRDLLGGDLDVARCKAYAAVCNAGRLADGRIGHTGQPGFSCSCSGALDTGADGFGLWWWVRWLPHTEPGPGFEDTFQTFSYTHVPTTTEVRLSIDPEPVETPAGTFHGCLLVTAEATQSDDRGGAAEDRAELNRIWCGRWQCWLARGIGPVAFRREPERREGVHSVLSGVAVAAPEDSWVPLSVGSVWEYVPAQPDESAPMRYRVRLTHRSDDGHVFFAHSCAARSDA